LANERLKDLGVKGEVNLNLGNAVKQIMDVHPSFNSKKEVLGRGFIVKTKPHLNRAMDHLERFAKAINGAEMHYQGIIDKLDSDEVDLETKVRVEDLAKQHVINLKNLHQKQKVTLTKITGLFLKLSKNGIKEMKRKDL
jgi:hypothetical protein